MPPRRPCTPPSHGSLDATKGPSTEGPFSVLRLRGYQLTLNAIVFLLTPGGYDVPPVCLPSRRYTDSSVSLYARSFGCVNTVSRGNFPCRGMPLSYGNPLNCR